MNVHDVGKDGIIFEYNDIVSLTGFNICRCFKEANANEKLSKISEEDILLSYFNREIEPVDEWLKQEYDIDFPSNLYMQSEKSLKPNLLYAYKIVDYAKKERLENFYIYSETYSPIIEAYSKSFGEGINVGYLHGEITKVLEGKGNYTYVTSNTNNIKKCINSPVPISLVLVDDYVYMQDIIKSGNDDKLRQRGLFVVYTSVISAGIVK